MAFEYMNQTLHLGDTEIDGPSLAEVCRRYGVKELSLFGSSSDGDRHILMDWQTLNILTTEFAESERD
jgi:hypothetical protein